MSSNNIVQLRTVKQVTQEGIYTLHGLARTKLIHRIIREYGKYCQGSYTVDLNDIDLCDQKLSLS